MSILALTSDTLIGTPASGNIEYNGQFFGTDSAGSRAQLQRLVLSTAVASTSGTSIDFTGIPAWVKRITVMLQGVSTNGTSNLLVQIGSGSVTTTGYSSASTFTTGAGGSQTTSTAGMITNDGAASSVRNGLMVFATLGSNTWISNHAIGDAVAAGSFFGGGSITLGGTLDRIRITTVNGTDAFDAGSVNIIYEG
jgi:hypothetical protein